MKIVSWNCRTNFDLKKANEIIKAYSDADILVVQECQKDWEKEGILGGKYSRGRWYGDIQNNQNEGICVFILNEKFKFACFPETFPNYRPELKFVLPFCIEALRKQSNIFLFSVWSKQQPYGEVLKKALDIYKFDEPSIFVGDFNTGIREVADDYQRQEKMFAEKGFINSAIKNGKEKAPTFFSSQGDLPCVDDFCYAKGLSVIEFDVGKKGLSDHCPICIDFDL